MIENKILDKNNSSAENCKVVDYYLTLYKGDLEGFKYEYKKYREKEKILNDIFKLYQTNTNFYKVYTKVFLLNTFYSTHILSNATLEKVAQKILGCEIDKKIKKINNVNFVDDLCQIDLKNGSRKFYSFATKYCCKCDEENYPIYDSNVKKVLMFYKKGSRFKSNEPIGFPNFRASDLKTYKKLKSVLKDFKKYYKISKYNYRQLDHFMWVYGKEILDKTNK